MAAGLARVHGVEVVLDEDSAVDDFFKAVAWRNRRYARRAKITTLKKHVEELYKVELEVEQLIIPWLVEFAALCANIMSQGARWDECVKVA